MAPIEPTLANMAHYGKIMADPNSNRKAIEMAKSAIREIVGTLTVDQHRILAIDVLGSLRERDMGKYTMVMMVVAINEGAL